MEGGEEGWSRRGEGGRRAGADVVTEGGREGPGGGGLEQTW